jgi:hypothetical protein
VVRLFYKKSGGWRMELIWEPHSGPGKFKLYQPGKIRCRRNARPSPLLSDKCRTVYCSGACAEPPPRNDLLPPG